MRVWGCVAFCAAFVLLGVTPMPAPFTLASSTQRAAAHRLFDRARATLKKSGVPVLLPGAIPAAYMTNLTTDGVRATPTEYGVGLALAPGCDGATACSFGGIDGSRSKTPLRGHKVRLALGVAAYVQELSCGASCPPLLLDFDYHGFRYELQAKLTQSEIVAFANTLVPLAKI